MARIFFSIDEARSAAGRTLLYSSELDAHAAGRTRLDAVLGRTGSLVQTGRQPLLCSSVLEDAIVGRLFQKGSGLLPATNDPGASGSARLNSFRNHRFTVICAHRAAKPMQRLHDQTNNIKIIKAQFVELCGRTLLRTCFPQAPHHQLACRRRPPDEPDAIYVSYL